MRRWLTAASLIAAAACASAAPPPGGPEDMAPPVLLRVTPESAAVNAKDRVVSFFFDETINDRGSGAQALDNFILVSPSDGSNRISWRRSRIDVRPRDGFRANTAYTVTLLPGLYDLRNNAMRAGSSVIFSTGPTIPTVYISGTAFDWATERPASRALIQAITPDSVVHLAQSDSVGQFRLGPLNAGRYLVRAIVDANSNRALDRNEAYDSVRVDAPRAAPLELLTIARDTLPPRLLSVSVGDSLTLRVGIDRFLDPTVTVAASSFRLVGPDSVPVAITAVLTPRQETEAVQRRDAARADSARRADSVAGKAPTIVAPVAPVASPSAVAAPPKPSVPSPPNALALRLARPLAPSTQYRLSVTALRGLSGRATDSDRSFITPRPAPPPAPRTAADSLATPPVKPPRQ